MTDGNRPRSEKPVDAFYERLLLRAATIDELLSDDFAAAGGTVSADAADRRLAAWRRAAANDDENLFERRLRRDGLTVAQAQARFSAVRRKTGTGVPAWIDDAIWIEAALKRPPGAARDDEEPCAFQEILAPVAQDAEKILESQVSAAALGALTNQARSYLRHALLKNLSALCAPALYERFAAARKAASGSASEAEPDKSTAAYDRFIAGMKARGLRELFEEKPVLLRLIATLTRQWIDATGELITRLDADRTAIQRDILQSATPGRVRAIEANLSDPHHGGRSVHILTFEDGARVVYKPKDLRADAAWHALIERLNIAHAPVQLKAARAIARDGYGWAEFVAHSGCADAQGCAEFYRRAGAWLALFHCFAATDMHQENWIAAGDHPVPIDLEMILQAPADEDNAQDAEGQAVDAAREIVAASVMMVGLLPGYARSPDNAVISFGGMTAEWNSKIRIKWNAINSDGMRPMKVTEPAADIPNLPHVNGAYARIGGYVDVFIAGFEAYATFLRRTPERGLFDGFTDVALRKVIRPTKFYDMLLQRLRNHRTMDDGVVWSAQADFLARLSDWDKDNDLLWPLHRAERIALCTLNVPHFVSPSDGHGISDGEGTTIRTDAMPGLEVARERLRAFDTKAIAWQTTVIRQNLNAASLGVRAPPIAAEATQPQLPPHAPSYEFFAAEADKIAEEISALAIRRGPGAAWIGLDWLGDSDAFQLACLGPDLYNGASGIALFLAAHATVRGSPSSHALALAGVAPLRRNLHSRNVARMARAWAIGGASGLGSFVYALTVMAALLRDETLRDDALVVAGLITDSLIAADKQLDVMAGASGAILGLLRLYRDTRAPAVLARAVKCGEHLLAKSNVGEDAAAHGLNGMSHGAAGFAYALSSLAAATDRDDFARAAAAFIAFEDASYDARRKNWPDLRQPESPAWPCQWCHGAPGIGLARIATMRGSAVKSDRLKADIENAVIGTEQAWPGAVDTLCCGTLGGIEFLCEAGDTLGRDALKQDAARRLAAVIARSSSRGDYRWNAGERQFNLGLFRGLAGVAYTLLRRLDETLPNVLIWE
jgi:type 2 lantibiotic biosynthesis protein LanM